MVPLVPAAGEEVLLSPEVLDTATQAIAQLVEGDTVQERRAAAADVAKQVKATGLAFLRATSLVQELMAHLEAPTTGSSRDLTSLNVNSKQGALLGIWAMCELAPHASEPFLVPELGRLLSFCSDRSVDVSDAAAQAARALVNNMSPYATSRVVPVILEQMFSSKSKWLVKRTCAVLLADLTAKAPKEISLHFPVIVPHLSDLMVDSKPEVAESAWSAMQEVCTLVDNSDIEPFALQLLNCIVDPTRVPDLVHQLGAITFAQIVTRGTLALMVPLLIRGLRERNTPVKRKCAAIIDNMCRLVESPAEVAPFVGMLLPSLDNVRKEVADPECREVVDAAYRTLQRVSGQAEGFDADAEAAKDAELPQAALGLLKEALEEHVPDADLDEMDETLMQHVAHLSCSLVRQQRFTMDVWSTVCTRYLAAAHFSKPEEDVHICQGFLDRCRHAFAHRGQAGNDGDDEEGVDLCDAEFSLAYGGRILLNNAHLRLKVGRRYGLCGANGVGKSTLMRAISRGQVDGFPPADQLRTVYVEHDIQGATEDMSVVDFVLSDPDLASSGREKVEEALRNVGFLPSMMALSIVSLSGGWKMKLALARAMLLNAGLLLLDEPTNHLDVNNVKWLQDYLTSGLQDVTCLIVSHDTSFLDTVCTDIIDYANRKLTRYKGNLSEFVKVKPEARAYYSLQSNNLEFSFPKPGFLDGVKSREKPVLKAKKVSFTYEGASKPQLTGVSLKCSLGSRIAVLGANGAGKSTLIKLLTGELKPESGEVDKHPNLRLAYVAQHAFHHIEEFLELTPNLYISKRFARGEDIEEKEKVFRKMSEEERSRLQTFYVKGKNVVVKEAGPGVMERKIDCLLSRRKKKRNFEYEVRWKGLMSLEYNSWLARDLLIETGHGKMVNELDGKKAAAAGDTRQLTKANIEAFLSDFGLDAEIATHSHIRGLSGGQKVKLVLAAAMWHNPHLLIMDEPTNYLDRDSLGALATAIQRFEGGVILISHNSEFVSALCNEEWRVADGKVAVVKKAGPAEAEAMEGSASGTNKAA